MGFPTIERSRSRIVLDIAQEVDLQAVLGTVLRCLPFVIPEVAQSRPHRHAEDADVQLDVAESIAGSLPHPADLLGDHF